MRALFIYSKYDTRQVKLIEKAKSELQGLIDVIEIEDCPDLVKRLVRETPALIHAEEHLQGIDLLSESVDGQLLLTAEMYRMTDRSEKALHNVDNCRLDSHIVEKQTESIDNYTMDLIIEGVI